MDIPLKSQCFDLAFSPVSNHVYVGLLNGTLKAFSYAGDNDSRAHAETFSLRPTKQSCRGLAISNDGRKLYAVSKDKALRAIDPSVGKLVDERPGAHNSAINRVAVCTPHLIATGDDDGVVKLWDPRKQGEVRSYSRHFDFISDLLYFEDRNHLIASSGDCTLTIMDVRSPKPEPLTQSQDQDDEFLSLCALKSNTKLIVGTQTGLLNIFNRSTTSGGSSSTATSYASPVDRMPGHPSSVDALVPLTDDVIATGSSDGLVRVVQILPNKLLGAVADHGDFPIERLALSRDKRWLASASHDELLKMTDVADALEESDGEEGVAAGKEDERQGVDSDQEDDDTQPKTGVKRRAPSSAPDVDDDGDTVITDANDLAEAEAPKEEDDNPVEAPAEPPVPRPRRKRKNKKAKGDKQQQSASSNTAFFADL